MRRANDLDTKETNANIMSSARHYEESFKKFTEMSTPFSSPNIEKLGELVRKATDFCKRIISE